MDRERYIYDDEVRVRVPAATAPAATARDDGEIEYLTTRLKQLLDQKQSTETTVEATAEVSNAATSSAQVGHPVSVKRSGPVAKLEKFDGTTSLETFLFQYHNNARYYHWDAEDRRFHLQNSLKGMAAEVTWQLSDEATEHDIIDLLQGRFGSMMQAERYRAELSARKRLPGESLQKLYNDIRRLLALAYPGESGPMFQSVGRDAFLAALNDNALRVRVLDQSPTTIDAAFTAVLRMEAYSGTPAPDSTLSPEDSGSKKNLKVRSVNRGDREQSSEAERLRQMENDLASQRDAIKKLQSEADHWRKQAERRAAAMPAQPVQQSVAMPAWYQTTSCVQAPPATPAATFQSNPYIEQPPWAVQPVAYSWSAPSQNVQAVQQPSGWASQAAQPISSSMSAAGWSAVPPMSSTQGHPPAGCVQNCASGATFGSANMPWSSKPHSHGRGRGQGHIGRDVCKRCHKPGHWARSCPLNSVDVDDSRASNVSAGVFSVDKGTPNSAYLEIDLHGKRSLFLIDSGSQQNIIPKRMVKNAILARTDVVLTAANGTKISACGAVTLKFKVDKMSLSTDFVVTEDLDEPLLGLPFLVSYKCLLDFDRCELTIDKRLCVPLISKPYCGLIRRIYVHEGVTVPRDTQMNVPVKMPLTSFEKSLALPTDWVTNSKEVREGLIMSRTLLSSENKYAAVRFVNISNKDQFLREGYYLGNAEPGVDISAVKNFHDSDLTDGKQTDQLGVADRETDSSYTVSCANQPDFMTDQIDSTAVEPVTASNMLKSVGGFQMWFEDETLAAGRNNKSNRRRIAAAPTLTDHTDATNFSDNMLTGVNSELLTGRSCSIVSGVPTPEVFDSGQIPTVSSVDSPGKAEHGQYDHLQPMLDKLPEELTEHQRRQISDLLHDYADVFSKHEYDLGRTTLYEAKIETKPVQPISEPLRRHPRQYLQLIDDQVEKLEEAGIVEPCVSSWSSNVVLVSKKGSDTPRVTIDYRKLNEVTYKDKYPLPKISDCLDALSQNVWFTTLDLSNSYFQCGIREQDREKTAFVTRTGMYQFTVLPQGLCNSPSVFSRLMSLVLRGLTFVTCLVFIDDTICLGRSFEDHLKNLREIFGRFRQANLKLKPAKCFLFQKIVKFLGFVVSQSGVHVDEDKIAVIKNWEFPRNVTELRSFLGLCNYYRSFCPDFSTEAEPLTEMLRKDVVFEQNQRRLDSFGRLKQLLTTAPVLSLPRDTGLFVLDTDCSDRNLGAVLQQYQDGELKVLEYASKTLNPQERRYCTTRKEMLALIYGLRYFRSYLLGQKFLVRVDHNALTYYQRMKEPSGQAARFLDFIADYDFDIEFRAGRLHGNADSLSRIRPCELQNGGPCRQCNKRVIGRHSVKAVKTRSFGQNQVHYNSCKQRGCVGCGGYTSNVSKPRPQLFTQVTNGSSTATDYSAHNRTSNEQLDRHTVPSLPVQNGNTVGDESDSPVNTFGSEPSFEDDIGPRTRAKLKARRQTQVKTKCGRQKNRHSFLQHTAPNAAAELGDWTPEYLRECQVNDPDINPVLEWAEADKKPEWGVVKASSPALKSLWQQFDSLKVINGLLHREFYDSNGDVTFMQYVLPSKLKMPFLELIHCSVAGHLKFEKCVSHVQQRVWWFSWRRDLRLFIQCCEVCESFHRGKPPKQANMKPMGVGQAAYRWHIDLHGPTTPSAGYKYIFVAIDAFTKYAIAVPIRDKESETVARVIMDHIILKFGFPGELMSDRGLEFCNQVTQEICNALGIDRLKTTAHRPSANGQIERFNRTLNSLLAKVIADHQKDWPQRLNYVMFCYNCSVQSSTGFSPLFLMTGRTPRACIDYYLGENVSETVGNASVPQYALQVLERLQRAYQLVRENVDARAEYTADWYNRKVRPVSYNVGDKVRVFNPATKGGRSPKWACFYKDVATVLKRFNDATYLVVAPTWRKPRVVHVDKLKWVHRFNADRVDKEH